MRFLLTILLFCTLTTNAKNYYFSTTDGNDSYTSTQAQSQSTPWKTIAKLNSFFGSLVAGDVIYFKRGDTFYGGIVITKASITFDAYGSGAKPIITGLSTVTGWVNIGTNLWEAPVTNVKADVNLVLRNGVVQQVGRYPNANASNSGYLTYTASTLSSITGPALSSTTNWTGAEAAIRINRWTIRKQVVTSHSGGVVNFASQSLQPKVGYGYFFQRDARTLDQDGEWWYDATNSKLRVYSTSNPSTYTYQISTVDTLLGNNLFLNNITVRNIAFEGANKSGVSMYSGSGQTISNVDVNYSGGIGIRTRSSFNVDVNNCTTNNCLGGGIKVWNDNATPIKLSVTNCNVDSTALIAGMENSDVVDNGSVGISVRGEGGFIQYNRVTKSGYIGIDWANGSNFYVLYNYVDYFCSVRDDGAGIYTFEAPGGSPTVRTNRYLIGNIVLNAIGANNGAVQDGAELGTSARGLYFDEGANNIIVDSNTVAYCIGMSTHGNNNTAITITNNLFYQNKGAWSFQRLTDGAPMRNINIKKNIVYPFRFEYRNLALNQPSLTTARQDLVAMGTMDTNWIKKKASDSTLSMVTTYSDLSNFKDSTFGLSTLRLYQEKVSTEITSDTVTFLYNASTSTGSQSLPSGTWQDIRTGAVYTGSVSISPYSSVLLTKTTPSVLTPPTLTAASGATVDGSFIVTFTDDASWRSAVTGIVVGSTTLSPSAYSITSGQITFTPSASTLLQSSGTKSITVAATGYDGATVSQSIGAGAAAKLSIQTQPVAPVTNGNAFVVQPVINIQDLYGNNTSSTATVVAMNSSGWTIGGTSSKAAVSGTATFTNLTATSSAVVAGASIIFSCGSLTGVESTTFTIPYVAPRPPNTGGKYLIINPNRL